MAIQYGYRFTDLVSGKTCFLLLVEGKYPVIWHPKCTTWAHVTAELDAFYCAECGWNGRVSGAWIADLIALSNQSSGAGQ